MFILDNDPVTAQIPSAPVPVESVISKTGGLITS
jgi:hypothetical protein